jgi:cell division protein FtsA
VGIAGQHIRSARNRGYINRDSYETEITKEDIYRLIKDMQKIPVEVKTTSTPLANKDLLQYRPIYIEQLGE